MLTGLFCGLALEIFISYSVDVSLDMTNVMVGVHGLVV